MGGGGGLRCIPNKQKYVPVFVVHGILNQVYDKRRSLTKQFLKSATLKDG